MVGKHRDSHPLDYSLLPIFNGVPADLLQFITPEMVHFYNDGDIIFAEGADADNLVVLLHGQVRILVDGIFLVTREPYEVLGEQAFINQTTRSATVIAMGMVKALVLPRHFVEQLLRDATFVGNLLRQVSEKLIEATNERAFRFRNEKLLFNEFRAHTSPELTQKLLGTGLNYGEPRFIDGVILFSDIRSFTERSAGMTPAEMASQLSSYLDAVVDVIHRHEGLIDKFIGDAVMAIWGFAPSEADSVVQAFTCAQEMVHTASQIAFGGKPITIGVGLNAGQVFIGNIGGDGKRQFTVLGTPVNLAARFEGESKALEAPIVMGKAFYEWLPPDLRINLRVHENRPIKGAEPQTLYTYDPADGAGQGEKYELGLSTKFTAYSAAS